MTSKNKRPVDPCENTAVCAATGVAMGKSCDPDHIAAAFGKTRVILPAFIQREVTRTLPSAAAAKTQSMGGSFKLDCRVKRAYAGLSGAVRAFWRKMFFYIAKGPRAAWNSLFSGVQPYSALFWAVQPFSALQKEKIYLWERLLPLSNDIQNSATICSQNGTSMVCSKMPTALLLNATFDCRGRCFPESLKERS